MSGKPYAEVIGDPISHSKSPLIHNFWLGKLGIDAEYKAFPVKSEGLGEYFAQRRKDEMWRGCNVTVPHKESGMRFVDGPLQELAASQVDEMSPGYQSIGAVNVVVPRNGALLGANTDIDGVIGPINSFHDVVFNFGPVPPRSVVIIGAGGAARAAVAALKWRGWVSEWRIAVRRPEAGLKLLTDLELYGSVVEIADADFAGADILINASTMGMGETTDSPLSLSTLGNGSSRPLVFDMVYHPLETGLLRAAKKQGHEMIGGIDMLIGQASGAFNLFFGENPPRDSYAELRALLTA